MDVAHEFVNHNERNTLTTRSHKSLQKDENNIVGNLDVKQGITEGIIDNSAYTRLSAKQEDIDVKMEEDYIKGESLVAPAALTSKLHVPLFKIEENKVVGTLDVKQDIVAGTINNMVDNRLNIKLEAVDIKDELLVTPAASGSAPEEAFPVPNDSEYGAKHNSWQDFENMMMTANAKVFHSCSVCAYKTTRYYQLLIHNRTHTGEKPSACSNCEYKTKNEYNFARHMKIHTGEKRYSCSVCKYKTAVKQRLVEHMRTHTGEKPYSCSVCEYKAARKSNLVDHMKTHTGETSYSCLTCNYVTVRKHNLVQHMRSHTGEKSFSCSICDYKAAGKHRIIEHMRTHTGKKPYSCSVCEYKAIKKAYVSDHMKTHTGEKSYPCSICKYVAVRRRTLTQHMRTHTGEKPHS